jgi:hypothetical protein
MSTGGSCRPFGTYLATEGRYTEIDHDHVRNEILRNEDDEMASRKAHRRNMKEMVAVTLLSLCVLAFILLLLTWTPQSVTRT